jgi:hypothetical protein
MSTQYFIQYFNIAILYTYSNRDFNFESEYNILGIRNSLARKTAGGEDIVKCGCQ